MDLNENELNLYLVWLKLDWKKKDKRQKGERSLHYNACEKGESGQDSLIYLDLDLARV